LHSKQKIVVPKKWGFEEKSFQKRIKSTLIRTKSIVKKIRKH